ncbi:hypothetical protein BDQ12DRAFT_691807 [Crucibulum laeve]|uniref:Uncharacterized protein n=1 Tax=Crucibulum laeve TaxID=68775 RepID=A0A5C3LK62_9AGAR|nr:hypothetical protein BDQ12DRAFT_691807 [Crucibulum laeve]
MSEAPSAPESSSRGRGRGRGKSRGGLGKYLRARGRGRGFGRPAEFHKRLLLEGETPDDEEDEEAAAEKAAKFSRRKLGSNVDRYAEEEPELGSDGEPIVEPEIDLSSFLERQKISDAPGPALIPEDEDDDDIDTSLSYIGSMATNAAAISKKGRVAQIEWDEKLEEMTREKAAAEATWDLKTRFRAKSERMRMKSVPATIPRDRKDETYIQAPALPLADGSQPKPKAPKEEMEDFLDDLLT